MHNIHPIYTHLSVSQGYFKIIHADTPLSPESALSTLYKIEMVLQHSLKYCQDDTDPLARLFTDDMTIKLEQIARSLRNGYSNRVKLSWFSEKPPIETAISVVYDRIALLANPLFSRLSEEIIQEIFDRAEIFSFESISLVSKRWRRICNHPLQRAANFYHLSPNSCPYKRLADVHRLFVGVLDLCNYSRLPWGVKAYNGLPLKRNLDIGKTLQNLLRYVKKNTLPTKLYYVFVDSCRDKRYDAVYALLKIGFDQNQPYKVDTYELSYAAIQGNIGVLKLLLKGNANPNFVDGQGFTPLRALNKYWSPRHALTLSESVKILIKGGADPNERYNGKSLIQIAAESGHLELLIALIENGADVENASYTLLSKIYGGMKIWDPCDETKLVNACITLLAHGYKFQPYDLGYILRFHKFQMAEFFFKIGLNISQGQIEALLMRYTPENKVKLKKLCEKYGHTVTIEEQLLT